MSFHSTLTLTGILCAAEATALAQVGVRSLVTVGDAGVERIIQRETFDRKSDPNPPPITPLAPPQVLWYYDDVAAVPSSVAFSRAPDNAWVAEDLNFQRLLRFPIPGPNIPLETISAPAGSEVAADAAHDADLAVLVIETTSVTIRAYNSLSATPLWTYNVPSPYVDITPESMRISRDGAIVCCAVKNPGPPEAARLFILNAQTGALLRYWDYPGRIEGVDVSDDGSLCLATQGANGRLIDTATATEIFTGSVTGVGGYGKISGNGQVIVLGGFNLRVYAKSGLTYTQRINFSASNQFFSAVGVSREGSTVATMSVNYTNYLETTTRIFDVGSQASLGQYSTAGTGGYQDAPSAAAVSDDGSVAAVASWGTQNNAHPEVMVFNRSVNLIASLDTSGSVFALDLTGDGGYLLAGNFAQHANTLGNGGRVTCYHVREPVVPKILRVDHEAPPGGDGTSWAAAYQSLHAALAAALSGDEVWVAEGTYRPAGPGGDRNAAFALPTRVQLYGGFKGVTPAPPGLPTGETQRSQRNPSPDTNGTVLSGDLNGNDGPSFANNAENSYRVITAVMTSAPTVIDGFTISGANSNSGSYPTYNGGGLYTSQAVLTVSNCRFLNNVARYGGGMYNDRGGPTVMDCVFRGNRATTAGGGIYDYRSSNGLKLSGCLFESNLADNYGAGLYNDGSVTTAIPAVVDRCTFLDNDSGYWGGGIYNWVTSPTITNCRFLGNGASNAGGAMYNEGTTVTPARGADPTIVNCAFSGNTTGGAGGAMRTWIGSPVIINSTFGGNTASLTGGGMEVGYLGNASVTNSIFRENTDAGGQDESAQIHLNGGALALSYSSVQSLSTYGGVGNTAASPHLADLDGPDNVAGTLDDDLRLRYPSPAIDTGNNAAVPGTVSTDLDGKPRKQDGNADALVVVDMGAYEYEFHIPADFNGDRDVDAEDLDALHDCRSGPAVPLAPACTDKDLDGDGDSDLDDFGVLQRCYTGPGAVGNPACAG